MEVVAAVAAVVVVRVLVDAAVRSPRTSEAVVVGLGLVWDPPPGGGPVGVGSLMFECVRVLKQNKRND